MKIKCFSARFDRAKIERWLEPYLKRVDPDNENPLIRDLNLSKSELKYLHKFGIFGLREFWDEDYELDKLYKDFEWIEKNWKLFEVLRHDIKSKKVTIELQDTVGNVAYAYESAVGKDFYQRMDPLSRVNWKTLGDPDDTELEVYLIELDSVYKT